MTSNIERIGIWIGVSTKSVETKIKEVVSELVDLIFW